MTFRTEKVITVCNIIEYATSEYNSSLSPATLTAYLSQNLKITNDR